MGPEILYFFCTSHTKNSIPSQFKPIQWTPYSYFFFYLKPTILFPFFCTIVFQVALQVFQLYTFYYIVRFTTATKYIPFILKYIFIIEYAFPLLLYIYIYICGWLLRKEWLLFSPLVVTATRDTDEILFAVFSPECSAVVSFMMAFLCSAEMTA